MDNKKPGLLYDLVTVDNEGTRHTLLSGVRHKVIDSYLDVFTPGFNDAGQVTANGRPVFRERHKA